MFFLSKIDKKNFCAFIVFPMYDRPSVMVMLHADVAEYINNRAREL